MSLLEELRKSDRKSKEQVTYLSTLIKKNIKLLDSLKESLANAKPPERGALMEALEYATQDNSTILKNHLNEVVDYLNDKAPKVKWEAARVLANTAKEYPSDVAKGVEKLLINTKDAGTVVRWSAAFALGEIAKNNQKIQANLVKQINEILKTEKNNGVKNVYLKALKDLH